MKLKPTLKSILGELPLAAEAYWQIRQNGKPLSKSFSMRRTRKRLPEWRAAVETSRQVETPRSVFAEAKSDLRRGVSTTDGKQVLIFATLRYWLEHATLVGMAFSGLGHEPTLAYLPYANWRTPLNRFDLRRHNAYARSVLAVAEPFLKSVSFLDVQTDGGELPRSLVETVRDVSLRDVQYTLQIEEVDLNGDLYHLRLERNLQAASAALTWMTANLPDVVLTPNGSILEMAVMYQVARYLGIPVVTYEFGEQRGRIWLAHNAEVMRQETDALWEARKDNVLTDAQRDRVRDLYASRQRADLWQNFSRRWQGQPGKGGEQVRADLGLDARPVVLLPANVIGDSLTLGRQVFSESMTEWLLKTVDFFASRPEVQLVVRIHPGERYTKGPSVAEVIIGAFHEMPLPEMPLPENIHLVGADDPVNTYDLVEIADLGLVYTTTVGLEMAMSGAPVVIAGQTHYRNKGFSLDPASWESYFQMLDMVLKNPGKFRLSKPQVDQAWTYAYRFFFDYPRPFPWHLLHFWNELETWSMARVLSAEGQAEFGDTFRYLVGEPVKW